MREGEFPRPEAQGTPRLPEEVEKAPVAPRRGDAAGAAILGMALAVASADCSDSAFQPPDKFLASAVEAPAPPVGPSAPLPPRRIRLVLAPKLFRGRTLKETRAKAARFVATLGFKLLGFADSAATRTPGLGITVDLPLPRQGGAEAAAALKAAHPDEVEEAFVTGAMFRPMGGP